MSAVLDERLTTSVAARVAGVSEQTIRSWTKSGRLAAESTPLGRVAGAGLPRGTHQSRGHGTQLDILPTRPIRQPTRPSAWRLGLETTTTGARPGRA